MFTDFNADDALCIDRETEFRIMAELAVEAASEAEARWEAEVYEADPTGGAPSLY